jgi:uncharacterized protein YbjQ (UPF0145 family)
VLYRSPGTKPRRSDRDKDAAPKPAEHNGEAGSKPDDATDGTKEDHHKTGDTFKESAGVLVTTRGVIANHEIVREVGIIVGSSVKSRHVGHDLWARVQGVFGLSVVAYAEMMVDSSAEATHNLMNEASRRGANAVLRVRYETAASSDPAVWSSTFSYTLAYGTAVVVRPIKGAKQTSWRDAHSDDDDDDDDDD